MSSVLLCSLHLYSVLLGCYRLSALICYPLPILCLPLLSAVLLAVLLWNYPALIIDCSASLLVYYLL
eukprot:10817357-Heterocapsa_arctica.AAC.1